MSIEHRRTKAVYAVIQQLIEKGQTSVRPGDVASVLRERGQPLGTWQIRGEFSILEAEGLIRLDEDSGSWVLSRAASRKATG